MHCTAEHATMAATAKAALEQPRRRLSSVAAVVLRAGGSPRPPQQGSGAHAQGHAAPAPPSAEAPRAAWGKPRQGLAGCWHPSAGQRGPR